MLSTLREMFDPSFLSRNSVAISLLVGFVCPLAGVYLVLRRVVFLGVALPQVSSCGIAFAFALQGWGWIPHAHDSAEERAIAMAGSIVFTLAAILVLSTLERRGRGMIEGRTGTVYVVAGAWSILLLVQNPFGEHGMLELLRGEIVAVSNTDLLITAGAFLVVIITLFTFQKEFLLVSFDREMALTLRKNVLGWDALLFGVIGLVISVSVMTVGPLVAFGFVLLPPLIAYPFCRNMLQFALVSSGVGGVMAVFGFAVAYQQELPVGPTDVALLGVLYAVAWFGQKAAVAMRQRRRARAG
jgi:ABC-type Mn2+/Zn2+ transport system permease subunit